MLDCVGWAAWLAVQLVPVESKASEEDMIGIGHLTDATTASFHGLPQFFTNFVTTLL